MRLRESRAGKPPFVVRLAVVALAGCSAAACGGSSPSTSTSTSTPAPAAVATEEPAPSTPEAPAPAPAPVPAPPVPAAPVAPSALTCLALLYVGTPAWKNQIPQAIVDAFEAEGFAWGGRWYHYDTMHFEWRPELRDPRCRSEIVYNPPK